MNLILATVSAVRVAAGHDQAAGSDGLSQVDGWSVFLTSGITVVNLS